VQFARPHGDETNTNIAPLLDVVLLLLIFFMVTTSFADRQLPLDLPSSESGGAAEADSIVVAIDEEGNYSVDNEPLSETELTALLTTIALQERNLEIRADTAARHGYVVRVLDLAKQLDLTRVGITVGLDD
jgi:biopolymer transport protein ExbD